MSTLTAQANSVVIVAAGAVAFALSLLARRLIGGPAELNTSPWSATLSYIATAFGIVIGFWILFLFGLFADSRQAVGVEASAIGTAFEEVALFPDGAPEVRTALICYAEAMVQYEWPALQQGRSAPEADLAYRNIILALGDIKQPFESTFEPAAATNIFVQVGDISTARETRLVAAQTPTPVLMWVLLLGGGLMVLVLVFVVSLPSAPVTQAVQVGLTALFTAVMIALVAALSNPFAAGAGRVTPDLIDEVRATMAAEAPDLGAAGCGFEPGRLR